MQKINLRLIGLVGGAILLLGVLLIGSQHFSDLTGGANAGVVNYDLLPPQITISGDQYRHALELLDTYSAHDDLATKNQIVQSLRDEMSRWVK